MVLLLDHIFWVQGGYAFAFGFVCGLTINLLARYRARKTLKRAESLVGGE